jgi:sterol 3beta-glucosyltransferase
MNITILTTGSRGDTQPYIALGMELKQAGHAVRLAAFQNYETFVTDHGLDFFPIRGDVSLVAKGASGRKAAQVDNPLKLLLSFNDLKDHLFDLQQDFFNACRDSDIIVYHPGAAVGYFAAQHFNIPSVLATPFPMAPTREYPSLIFYDKPRLGRGYNFLTHKIMESIFWFASASPLKAFWKQEFGKLPQGFSSPFGRQVTRKYPTIISCSEHVFHTPEDRSEHIHTTGYWFMDETAGWAPSPELNDFLQSGSKPVYIGFGSMVSFDGADQTTALVIEALRMSGQRGVLATGWDGMSKMENLPKDIFMLESAPHSWLFPRMAAVVHHGGAGTTAEGLRAGVPSVIVPHANDQYAWGQRVYELGVGPKPIPRKKLTAENLADAIQSALTDEIKTAATSLGEKIRAEKGTEKAASVIIEAANA